MKRLVALILVGVLSMCTVLNVYGEEMESAEFQETGETETETEAPPEIKPDDIVSTDDIVLYSEGAVVMDLDTGAVLYSKNMDRKLYPASITKVLTGYLACTHLDSDGEVLFTQEAIDGIDIWMDMNIGLEAGEVLTVDQALHALMMVSANEVACGLAVAVSGSISSFVDLMNQTAESIGCENTHFVNPNGLHDVNHYTTAYDMAKIAALAYTNETFRSLIQETVYVIDKTNKKEESIELIQQHKMYMESDYTYEGCTGGKTGYTSEAGSTLVTYAERDGMRLVCVTMKAENWHHYTDTILALDYCFNSYHQMKAADQTDLALRLNAAYMEYTGPLDFNRRMSRSHFFVDENAVVDTYKDGSIAEWTERFVPSGQLISGIPPYNSYTSQCGVLEYYRGNICMGKVPVYEVLPFLDGSSGLSMKTAISNARLISMLEEKDTQEPVLKEDRVISTGQQVVDWIGGLKWSAWLIIFGILMLLLIVFVMADRALRRRRKRKNYERLRKKRLEEKIKRENEKQNK